MICVSKYVQSLILDTLLNVEQAHLQEKATFACPWCKAAFSIGRRPLSLECGHLCCLQCSHSILRGSIASREHKPCLICPACKTKSLHVHSCDWCVFTTASKVAWCNRKHMSTTALPCYRHSFLASMEAELEKRRLEQTLASLIFDVSSTGSLGLWWNLIATDLIVLNNAGKRPRHLHHLDRISIACISRGAQRNLHHVADEILQLYLAKGAHVADIVWHELLRRARCKMLRFMIM